jgi:hypothetical protein
MRSRPRNPDGTVGFCVKPGMPEWDAWRGYFEDNGLRRQLSVMRSRGPNGYMVPCANPRTFDPLWKGKARSAHDRLPATAEERNAVLRRLSQILPGLARHVEGGE